MGSKRSKLSFEATEFGVRVSHDEGERVIETELSFAEAIQLLLELGEAVGAVNVREREKGISVERQSALTLPTLMGSVATINGRAMFVVEVNKFPTLRLPIANEALRGTAQALMEIAGTPEENRNSKPN